MMYIKDGVNEYSFSTETFESEQRYELYAASSNKVIKEESVALHAYEYVRTPSGKYYYGVDIPSYSINPNNWCGWISVWDDGSRERRYAKECFRLMGFDDTDFDTLRALYPKREGKTCSILYKQAGNSIVVDVLEAIVKIL